MMPLIEFCGDHTFRSEGENWKISFDVPSKGMFTLSAGEQLNVTSLPAALSGMSETSALPERRRIHGSGDGRVAMLNAAAKIPFGAEPEIKREFSLSENRLDVMTDFVMRTSMCLENIDGGGVAVSGKIVRVGIIQVPVSKSVFPHEIKWTEFPGIGEFYFGEEPPLSVIVESENGMLFELSIGEDLWRWTNAGNLDGKSEFKVFAADGVLQYIWHFYERIAKPDVPPQSGRNWRFNYFIAWGKKNRKSRKKVFKSVFDVSSFKWDNAPLSLSAAGKKVKKIPCFTANSVINQLKQWVRSELADLHKGDVLLLKGVQPGVCQDAAHLKRSRKEQLPHYTLPALLDFRRWAEKQLAASGAELMIETAEDSPFAELPSLKNL